MKVKNIMFAGFAAAIFASVAGAANAEATYELASKQYVDARDATLNALDEKLANKVETVDEYKNLGEDADKDTLYTSVSVAEKIAANAAGSIDMGPVNAADGSFFKQIKVENGTMTTEQEAFVSDVVTNAESLVAPQTKAIKTYVDSAIKEIGDTIGGEYQKLDEKLTSADTTTVVDETNKDKLYPTVGKVQAMDDAQTAAITEAYEEADATTLNSAKAYTDEEIAKLDVAEVKNDAGFISSVSETDGKVTAVATAFETVIDDTTKDSAIAPQTAAVKTYVDAEIEKVNSGAAWLEENTASKQYIVQTDTDGNEVLVEIAIIGENGQPVYTEVKSAKNTDETTQQG